MPGKYPCFKCDEEVKNKGPASKAVVCGYCKLWVHQACLKISDDVYNWIAQQQHYICEHCKNSASETKQQLMGFTTRLEELEERDKLREKAISDMRKQLEDVDTRVTRSENAQKNTAKDTETAVLRELNDRESRKCNFIMYNVKESNSEVGVERKEHDKKILTEILAKIELEDLNVDDDVVHISRMGELNPERERPMMVKMAKETARDSVLKSARKLKDTEFCDISIKPDLTRKQRDMDMKTRAEMERRNKEMDPEEAKNWEWRMEGRRGWMTLEYRRIRRKDQNQTPGNARGVGRGAMRGRGRGRGGAGRGGAPVTGANRERLGSTKRTRLDREVDEEDMQGQEEAEDEVEVMEPPAKK